MAHKQMPCLATSIDAVVVFGDTTTAICEIKTKTNAKVIAASRVKAREVGVNSEQVRFFLIYLCRRISIKKYVIILLIWYAQIFACRADASDILWKELCEHKAQVLHEAAVTDCNRVLYIVSSVHDILYMLMIEFDLQQLREHLRSIHNIIDPVVGWIFNGSNMPPALEVRSCLCYFSYF